MEITVKHEIPCDSTEESRCIYGGDFWGNEVCRYHTHRDRTHGRKAPIERQQPKCTLFDEWLPGDYMKCESCRKAIKTAGQNPQPLTIDELWEMEGKPVWIVGNGKTECGVVSLEGNCFEKEPVITLANGNYYLLKEYNGKTWPAYRTKPEGSGK